MITGIYEMHYRPRPIERFSEFPSSLDSGDSSFGTYAGS